MAGATEFLVKPFNLPEVPSPRREILAREVEKLKARDDVLAIGIAGSTAYGDTWFGSDLDIEVVVKGDKPKQILTTEQEISVDFGIFGENNLKEIPYDTRPVYDPAGILTRELSSRNRDELIERDIQEGLDRGRSFLERGEIIQPKDPYSALVFVHLAAWQVGYAIPPATGENRTIRRTVTRLEKGVTKIGRQDLLGMFGKLFGFPRTLQRVDELMVELQEGYREIWSYFKEKGAGPVYMQQQPDSEAWFRNRIKPLYEHDRRDLVWLVYVEFPFVLSFILRLAGHVKVPANVFEEADKIKGQPELWTDRYRRILSMFTPEEIRVLLQTSRDLIDEVKKLSELRLWARHTEARHDSQ